MAHVDELGPVAWALWHCRTQLVSAEASSSEAKLPAALATEASDLFKTMVRVVEYNLVQDADEDGALADELAAMRVKSGSRYLRIAQSLSRLSAVYRDPANAPVLADDKRRYKAEDADRAQEVAGRILDVRDGLREVLSHAGARDGRVLAALLDGIKEAPGLAGGNLAVYGDPAALPALHALAERTRVDDDGPFAGPGAHRYRRRHHDARKYRECCRGRV